MDIENLLKLFPPVSARLKDVPLENKNALQLIRERDREDHDERGAMIRPLARARAGDVLLWLLLFGAAYLYFFDVPKWVSLILLGLACVKLLLDWMFTVWYRRQY